MAYATPLDILASWPKVHVSGLTHDELRTMISRAGNRIDAALAGRYSVPFVTDPSSAPPLIKDLTVDLAMLDVLYRSPNTPEWISGRLTAAQALLTALMNGELSVVGADGTVLEETTSAEGLRSTTSAYTPVFGGVPSLGEGWSRTRYDAEVAARGDTVGYEDDVT